MAPMGIISYNTHQYCWSMITKKTYFSLWLMIFVFSIPQWKMQTIFLIHSKKNISSQSIWKQNIYRDQAGLVLCEQNRHIVNATSCEQGLAHISTHFDGRQEVFPPCLHPNPIWTENPIYGPFGCVGILIRKRNQPTLKSLWKFLVLRNLYQQHYSPSP